MTSTNCVPNNNILFSSHMLLLQVSTARIAKVQW